jgi:probable dihydroxyacetone kinase regulator
MADFTKKAIVDAFARILKEKPFEKITISDITSECGVSRMTFYYHFEDIYDMLDYVIAEKLSAPLSRKFTYELWQQDYTAVFEAILQEKNFFSKIFHSVDLRKIEQYLSVFAHGCVSKIVEEQILHFHLNPEDRSVKMICDIYSYCMVGLLLDWISKGMHDDPTELVSKYCDIIKGTMELTLKNASKE